jgi:periplasmic divalent cation tolerance protein
MMDLSTPTNVCIALITCGNRAEAEAIAEAVVTERLAACANLVGGGDALRSIYIWEDALQNDTEILLLLKTDVGHVAALEARVKALHSYTVPEFLVLPVLYGSASYLEWVKQSVGSIF